MVNRLIEIIGREAALFESFLELLEQQQKMLVANNHDGLIHVTDRLREKLVESQLLAKSRVKLVEEISAANAIEGDLNVSRLLEIIDQDQADRLVTLQKSILGLYDKITHTRNQNALLLNQSREHILKTVEMLAKINSPEPVYTPAGLTAEQRSNLAVDRRV